MARGTPHRFRRFGRGLNTADGQYNLREGYEDDPSGLGSECRDCLNVVSKHRGNVSKRPGSITLLEREGVKDMSPVDAGADALLIFSTAAGKLYTLDADLTETEKASGLSTAAPWTWLQLPAIGSQGPYYGMNGTDTPRQIKADGTIGNWTATGGSLPNGTMMCFAGNRLWVADGPSLYWSDLGDPTSWPAANVTRFDAGAGGDITGLAALGSYVLVFKRDGVWTVYDLDTSANRRIADNAGTSSPRSVVPAVDGCFFLDPQGGVMLTDGTDVRAISNQILPTLQTIGAGDLGDVTAAFHDGHYYLAAQLGGGDTYTFDYHVELGSWWKHSHQPRALAVWNRGDDDELLAANPSTLARLMVDGITTDEDVAFRSYWSGPFHDFGSPHLRKRCREIQLDGSGTADIYVHSDFLPGPGNPEGAADFTGGNPLFGV